jgi:Domain of unknown function (DUF4398)
VADTGGAPQIVDARSQQAMHPAVRRNQLVRDCKGVAIAATAAEHERQQFVVAERGGAVRPQLFSRAIGRRQVFHRTTTVVYLRAMSRVGRCAVVSVAILVSSLIAGCGDDPPAKELQQAQQAIDEARASGADRYSNEEFNAAQEAVKRAQAAVVARDYRQALNDALDARDRAQNASKDAVDKKAKAKVDADRTLHDAALTIVDARAKLRAAETAHRVPARVLAPLRRDIDDAETRVQEARTAFDNGDYLTAIPPLNASMQRLNVSVRALQGGAPPVVKRKGS